jgi:glutamate/tyrosine decarboxylase-like PLP-dependent enzyme
MAKKPLDAKTLPILKAALKRLQKGFASLPDAGGPRTDLKAIERVLFDVAERLKDNQPFFHPLYAGQMLKPPHPVARLAYALAMWINPNNHALDSSRASAPMEEECVAALAKMIGWKTHLGHLTGGGTMANLEALWVASQVSKGVIVGSSQAHYTHGRISSVLGLTFEPIAADRRARMDMTALEQRLGQGGVGTVVVTLGTTATGSVDPLPAVLALREKYNFRVHVDAAYGGYFTLASNLGREARASFDALPHADSFVVDPHKHGLQPYGCGCVIFKDPSVGKFYKHDSPYTYFTSDELHLGEISLECSRAGAAAVALWATMELLPLSKRGAFAKGLADGRKAALALHNRVVSDARFVAGVEPQLDIFTCAIAAPSISKSSEMARRVFAAAEERDLHLAMADLPVEYFAFGDDIKRDAPAVTAIRSVLMKPEHLAWADEIWQRLAGAVEDSVQPG